MARQVDHGGLPSCDSAWDGSPEQLIEHDPGYVDRYAHERLSKRIGKYIRECIRKSARKDVDRQAGGCGTATFVGTTASGIVCGVLS